MSFVIDGDNSDRAWGTPLEPAVSPSVLTIGSITSNGLYPVRDSTIESPKGPTLGDVKQEALNRLQEINDSIEADIAYYSILGGLSLAMNKLAFIKQDLQKVMTGLERI